MENCKHCNSCQIIKYGCVKGKQRYSCKTCLKTSRNGDDRVRHSLEKKIKVLR